MEKQELCQDLKELLSLLIFHQTEFLLIGGYAIGAYTVPRYTKDIDLWVGRDKVNIQKLHRALIDFGFCFDNLDQLSSNENKMIVLGNPPCRVDILNYAKGLNFSNSYLYKKEVKFSFLDFELPIISKEDLIINKQAVGRPQDLVDVINLLKV